LSYLHFVPGSNAIGSFLKRSMSSFGVASVRIVDGKLGISVMSWMPEVCVSRFSMVIFFPCVGSPAGTS